MGAAIVVQFNPHHDDRGRFAQGDGPAATKLRDQMDEEYIAISDYTNNDYMDSNDVLRGKRDTGLSPGDKRGVRATIALMDRAFKHAIPLSKDIIVHRTTSVPRQFDPTRMGAVMRDKGFVSTTLNIGVASRMMARGVGSDLLTIHVPKGTRVLNVSKQYPGLGWRREQEVILPRGSKFRVRRDGDLQMLR